MPRPPVRRIAALYDIHGNLPALEAVLAEVEREAVEAIVVGGDVLPGPWPGEVLARLLALRRPVHCLMGNGDREVLACRAGRANLTLPEPAQAVLGWCAARLTPAHIAQVSSWPATYTRFIAPWGMVLFCHATPGSDTEIFTPASPPGQLREIFGGLTNSLVICGHTHKQFDFEVGERRVINAGSVGMPFDGPAARWLLLGSDVELRRTKYDHRGTRRSMDATGCPALGMFDSRAARPGTSAS